VCNEGAAVSTVTPEEVESALSGRNVWIKTATPRTGTEQGQKNTGKGKKGKKAKPEKVFMPVDKVKISF
jgi:hypothetical protein